MVCVAGIYLMSVTVSVASIYLTNVMVCVAGIYLTSVMACIAGIYLTSVMVCVAGIYLASVTVSVAGIYPTSVMACIAGIYLTSGMICAADIYLTSVTVCVAGIYLTSVMALTSMSVVLAVVVSNISSRGRKEYAMPRLFRCCITTLARILCFRLHYVTANVTPGRGGATQGPRPRPNVLYKGVTNHVSSDSGCGLVDFETNVDFPGTPWSGGAGQCSTSAAALRAEFRRSRRDEGSGRCPWADPAVAAVDRDPLTLTPTPTPTPAPTPTPCPPHCPDVEDILSRLRELLAREEEKDHGENLCRQWHEAAEVIDRFLFWVFVLGTALATVTSLVILPLAKKPLDPSVDIFGS